MKPRKLFRETKLEDLIGCVNHQGPPFSLEEIDRRLEEDIRHAWDRECAQFSGMPYRLAQRRTGTRTGQQPGGSHEPGPAMAVVHWGRWIFTCTETTTAIEWNASQRYWQPVAGQERTEAPDLETAERERSAAVCLAQDKALQACRMLYSAVQKCMETGGSLQWEDIGHAYAIAEETLALLGELPISPAVAAAGEHR